MRSPGAWLLPLLALASAPLARGEELSCEFSGGAGGAAALPGAPSYQFTCVYQPERTSSAVPKTPSGPVPL